MNVYFGVTEYWEINKLLKIHKNWKQTMKLRKEQKLFKKNHEKKLAKIMDQSMAQVMELKEK